VHCEGAVGPAYGTADGIDLDLGSGGGAAGNTSGCTNAGGDGGRGGGTVTLAASGTITVDGMVSAAGEQPAPDDSECGYRAGGGGGSGGGIHIAAPTIVGAALASLIASGGDGGEALGDQASTWGWGGGGGGGGRFKLFGVSSFAGTTEVAGGLGGVAPIDQYSFAGDPGADGSVGGADTVPAEFTELSCN
jgi:hypothetical protein